MAMGPTVDYDREITFKGEGSTWPEPEEDDEGEGDDTRATSIPPQLAVEGRDFVLLESIIPADSIWGVVRVKILASDELLATGYDGMQLKLTLLPNENFDTNYTAVNDMSKWDEEKEAYTMSGIVYKINFQAGTEGSALWEQSTWSRLNVGTQYSYWIDAIGDYSVNKINLIIDATDTTWEFWHPSTETLERMNTQSYMTTYYIPWALSQGGQGAGNLRAINKEIARLTAENGGNPPLEEDGVTPIELGITGKTVK